MPLPAPAPTAPLSDWTDFWKSYDVGGTNTFNTTQPLQAWNAEQAGAFGGDSAAAYNNVFGLPNQPGAAGTQADWANYYTQAQGLGAGFTPTALGADPAATYQGEFANPALTNQAQYLGFNQAYSDPASQTDWAKIFGTPSLSGITQTEYNNLYGNLNPATPNPLESAFQGAYPTQIAAAQGVQPGFTGAENAAAGAEQNDYNFTWGAYQGGAGLASHFGLPGPTAPGVPTGGFPAFDPWNATLDPSYLANTQNAINADVGNYSNYTNSYGGYITNYDASASQAGAQQAQGAARVAANTAARNAVIAANKEVRQDRRQAKEASADAAEAQTPPKNALLTAGGGNQAMEVIVPGHGAGIESLQSLAAMGFGWVTPNPDGSFTAGGGTAGATGKINGPFIQGTPVAGLGDSSSGFANIPAGGGGPTTNPISSLSLPGPGETPIPAAIGGAALGSLTGFYAGNSMFGPTTQPAPGGFSSGYPEPAPVSAEFGGPPTPVSSEFGGPPPVETVPSDFNAGFVPPPPDTNFYDPMSGLAMPQVQLQAPQEAAPQEAAPQEPLPADQNFSDPLSGLQMPQVEQQEQKLPAWLAGMLQNAPDYQGPPLQPTTGLDRGSTESSFAVPEPARVPAQAPEPFTDPMSGLDMSQPNTLNRMLSWFSGASKGSPSDAPSDAGLPSGSPGLTPDVVSPFTPFNIPPPTGLEGSSAFGGPPTQPNQAVNPPDFGSIPATGLEGNNAFMAPPEAGLQAAPMVSPQAFVPGPPEFAPGAPAQSMADNFGLPPPAPQTPSEKFVQDFGTSTTLRTVLTAIAAADKNGLIDGHNPSTVFAALGAGVDTPIDLTDPAIANNLTAALQSGRGIVSSIMGMGGDNTAEAVTGLMAGLTAKGIVPQNVADAASDVQQDITAGPNAIGPAPGATGPPTNFENIRGGGVFDLPTGTPTNTGGAQPPPTTGTEADWGVPPPGLQGFGGGSPTQEPSAGLTPFSIAEAYINEHGGHSTLNSVSGPYGAYKANPELISRLAAAGQAFEAATGTPPIYGEGDRDAATQAVYWQDSAHGTKYAAAPPGLSQHQQGNATDLPESPFRDWLSAGNAAAYGLGFPVKGDAPHVQMMDNSHTPYPINTWSFPETPGTFAPGPPEFAPGASTSNLTSGISGPSGQPLPATLTGIAPLLEQAGRFMGVNSAAISAWSAEENPTGNLTADSRGNKGLFQLEKGGTGTAEQQVQGLQDWWISHNIPGQLQAVGLQDISGFGLPQQAALMQAFALAPERVAEIILDVTMGSGNKPWATGQAKDLGTTSFNDMVKTFTPRFIGTGIGAVPGQGGALDTGMQFASASPGGPMVDPGAALRYEQLLQWLTQQPPQPGQPRPPARDIPGTPIVPGSPVWPFSGVQRL